MYLKSITTVIFCLISALSSQAQITIENAFPGVSFSRPVDLQFANDATNRLFVVEQNTGVVRVFENDPAVQSSSVYLSVADRFNPGGNEEGLLGLAFHPDFSSNGELFVYYSASNPRRSVIERFTADSSGQAQIDNGSGVIVLEVLQPNSNHNGGQIRFGPDGYLYIGLGDGGGAGDPDETGQDPRTLLGSMLRIDVDNPQNGKNYGIPADNPFVADTTGSDEVYAYGLRNPWRFSFDAAGNLWVGDVGQGRIEEVDIVTKGGNYGWNTMEGSSCYDPSSGCDQTGLTLPVHEYTHSVGQAITGGFVYRGSRVPDLVGDYIFGDYVSGRIWRLPFDGQEVGEAVEMMNTSLGIAAFGEDKDGELYICAFDGHLYHFTRDPTGVEGDAVATMQVEVFPNPSSGEVNFLIKGRVDSGVVAEIHDVVGRRVATLPVQVTGSEELRAVLDAAEWNLPSGLYLYSIQTSTRQLGGTFVLTN